MNSDKVGSLLGFAMKAGKTVFGSDMIERYRKKKYLLIVCRTLAEGSRKRLLAAVGKTPAIMNTERELGEIARREGLKAVLVTDRQMAQAMLDNMNGSYRLITEVD